MLQTVKGSAADLVRDINRMLRQHNETKQQSIDIESALVELADLKASQDDAIVEITKILSE